MKKQINKFIYKGCSNERFEPKDTDLYEADFELDNDGTPNGERFLRISVKTSPEKPSEISLSLISKGTSYDKKIGYFKTNDLTQIGNLLYPEARVKTIKIIEPV